MWGFIQSTFLTVPVNVIGLLRSNSADTAWCDRAGAAAENKPKLKMQTPMSFRFIDASNGVQFFECKAIILTQPKLSQADDLRFFIAAHSVMRPSHPTQTLIISGAPEAGPAGSRLDHPDHLDRLVRAAQLRPHHRHAEPRLEPPPQPAKPLPHAPG